MTTRREAETVLFSGGENHRLTETVRLERTAEFPQLDKRDELETAAEIPQLPATKGKDGKGYPRKQGELESDSQFANHPTSKTRDGKERPRKQGKPKLDRRRVDATYCPLCSSWIEVRLRPVRLHCTGCQREARP